MYLLGFEVLSFKKQFVLNSINLFSILQDISLLMDVFGLESREIEDNVTDWKAK